MSRIELKYHNGKQELYYGTMEFNSINRNIKISEMTNYGVYKIIEFTLP